MSSLTFVGRLFTQQWLFSTHSCLHLCERLKRVPRHDPFLVHYALGTKFTWSQRCRLCPGCQAVLRRHRCKILPPRDGNHYLTLVKLHPPFVEPGGCNPSTLQAISEGDSAFGIIRI
jgi:hypothetical protein